MPSSLIAQRYAKAIFELALEMNVVEEVKADMELISSVSSSSKDFVLLLKSPVIRAEKKIKVMEALFKNKISDLSMRYLTIITRKKRESFLMSISEEFINIYKKFKNIITIHFESAEAISDELRNKIVTLLEDQTKGTIEMNEKVKKELVGGFVISYDDYKYDASIAYQLRKLKKSAAEINFYIREL
ncbi:MAG: ATP synthase F1 subunit delta [Bacteroidota bacterium]